MNTLKTVLIAGFLFIAILFLTSPYGYFLYLRNTATVLLSGLGLFVVYVILVLKIKKLGWFDFSKG